VIGSPELLLAIPEHKVALPGGTRESQCDVFALVRGANQVVSVAVEAKVDEPFAEPVVEWLKDASPGKQERLAFILKSLGLAHVPGEIRYQLLHRTVSAVVEAERFMTGAAAMVVHSFSPERRWFDDYSRFVSLFGVVAEPDRAHTIVLPNGKPLHLAWATGDQRFRAR
jgi:hypothetical protein